MAAASGFPYPDFDSPLIEDVWVVADEQDRPVMALAAERIVQLYLWAKPGAPPAERLHILRLLDEAVRPALKAYGYSEMNAFIPPELAKRFGRRLQRTFGWRPNWPSWCKLF